MTDWTQATGMQLEMIKDALQDAFYDPDDFINFLLLRLNKTWALLAGIGANYDTGMVQVLTKARAAGWLGELITKAQQKVPGNPRLAALRQLGDLTGDPPPAFGRTVEDIVRTDGGFADVIPWIRALDQIRGQICRIESPVGQGVGTGWLVADDLVMTNGHVVAPILAGARQAASYACRFDYATDAAGTSQGTVVPFGAAWKVGASPASDLELGLGPKGPTLQELDYAVVRVASKVGTTPGPNGAARGKIVTKLATKAPAGGEILFILQHPSGDPLKMALGTSKGLNGNSTRVEHDVNTEGGSSGSPCFNAKLELVGLHNAGDPLYDGVHGAPQSNSAVPVGLILAELAAAGAPKFWV